MQELSAAVERGKVLVVGEDTRFAVQTLSFAGVLLVGAAALKYVYLTTGVSSSPVAPIVHALHLHSSVGVVLVIGLAGVHAYLNEGFVPSVALASAPSYGAFLWTIESPTRIANLHVTPDLALVRAVPEVPAYATLGFLLGVGVRIANERIRKRRSRPPGVESTSRS